MFRTPARTKKPHRKKHLRPKRLQKRKPKSKPPKNNSRPTIFDDPTSGIGSKKQQREKP
jgi:hypothetical protein